MRLIALTILLALSVSACASTRAAEDADTVYDPFENLNRKVYGFNDSVDEAVLSPVVRGYNRRVPKPARDGLHNFLQNLNSPVVFINDVLQAKPQRAGETLSRFIINTTVGLGGLFDIADKSGLEGHTEDFGQTLGVWGMDMGPYFVAPFLGPTNLRDTTGRIVDMAFDPLTWIEFGASDLDLYIAGGRTLATALDQRAALEPAFANLRAQPEPYIALRRAYTANRRNAVRDGSAADDPFQDLPDFDDFDDEFDDDFEDDFAALGEDG